MTTDEPREGTESADAPLRGARLVGALAWAALVLGLWALARLHLLDAWWRSR